MVDLPEIAERICVAMNEHEPLQRIATAAQAAVDCLPCRCSEAYASRGLQDPDCPCADLAPLRAALAAAPRHGTGEP